jgi:hypothetical protein
MQTTRANQGSNSSSFTRRMSHSNESHAVPPLLVLMVSLVTACGPAEEGFSTEAPEQAIQELEEVNGLSVNGLSVNGLSVNGLSVNGLSVNGLSTMNFQSWFQSNPTAADQVMRYAVLCAAPAGQVVTYTDPSTLQAYSWSGSLGLAPGWSSGQAPTVAEQQVVSACLAAHVNKYGVHISISVLGRNGSGQPIPVTDTELSSHSRREACIFGNVFTGQGIFVGNDGGALSSSESTTRICTVGDVPGTSRATDCEPMVQVGTCASYCTLDPTGTYYTSCTYNGVTYQPITTRLRAQDIYTCGDGVCQVTESCGSSNTWNSCEADCGTCP